MGEESRGTRYPGDLEVEERHEVERSHHHPQDTPDDLEEETWEGRDRAGGDVEETALDDDDGDRKGEPSEDEPR